MSKIRTQIQNETYSKEFERIFRKDEKHCADCKHIDLEGPFCCKNGTSEISPPHKGFDCFERMSEEERKERQILLEKLKGEY